jgi:uncharacterized heparinase superfamily protein
MRLNRPTFFSIKYFVRLFHTLRYLKWQQFFFRFYYPLKRIVYPKAPFQKRHFNAAISHPSIDFPCFDFQRGIFNASDNSFILLNKRHQFSHRIDWDFTENGLLWSFHLHYFEWLNDPQIDACDALGSIIEYIEYHHKSKINKYAYPTSIRIVNWIKFCMRHQVNDRRIVAALFRQSDCLAHFPEYEIMGNHLLENGLALVWAGVYFKDDRYWEKGTSIVRLQLEEQVLADGGHFERSAAYGSILLKNILEVSFLMATLEQKEYFYNLLKMKSSLMLSHLFILVKDAPFYPNFNDSNEQMSVPFSALSSLAQRLGIAYNALALSESGFTRFDGQYFHVVFNSGTIIADYQPGHAHADAFSFVLNWQGQPIIVDPAVSVYHASARRLLERSTIMHNTVSVEAGNSADVWSSFRLGRRCSINTLYKSINKIEIEHNGYFSKYRIWHKRQLECSLNKIEIIDSLVGWNGQDAALYLHFHPNVQIAFEYNNGEDNCVIVNDKIRIKFKYVDFYIENYEYAFGFNVTQTAQRLVGRVINEQVTTIIEF